LQSLFFPPSLSSSFLLFSLSPFLPSSLSPILSLSFFFDEVLLCCPGWPQTLDLSNPLASAFQVAGTTATHYHIWLFSYFWREAKIWLKLQHSFPWYALHSLILLQNH
jgi:hypothetical protein